MTYADLVERLAYSSYRAQREASPHVEPARWALVFGEQSEDFERRYAQENAGADVVGACARLTKSNR
ncbi:MAG: hypothetical protein VW405_16830 [Rhodospirillaceae bacterium]